VISFGLPEKNSDSLYIYVYKYKLSEAANYINIQKLKPNECSESEYLAAVNYYWWQYISGVENDSVIRKVNFLIDDGIRKLGSVKKQDNERLFSMISLYAFKTRFQLINRKYFSAINNLGKAISTIKLSFGKENNYENFKLTTGLYLYTMSYAIEEYPVFYPYLAFYPEGDKQKGIGLLKECSLSQNIYLKTEALYFLMKIYLDSEKNYKKAEQYSRKLISLYPGNLVYLFHHYLILKHNQNSQEAAMTGLKIREISEKSNSLNKLQKEHFVKQL
jgi:hypothetical protein